MSDKSPQLNVFGELKEREVPKVRRVVDVAEIQRLAPAIAERVQDVRTNVLWGVYDDLGQLLKITEQRDVERLGSDPRDRQAYQKIYLKGLLEEAPQFGSTHAIESAKSPDQVQDDLNKYYVAGIKLPYVNAEGESDFKLVGMGTLRRKEGAESHVGYIGRMYVYPSHRDRKLAHNIMAHLLERADQDGYEKIELIVTASNKFALAFYEKLGFVRTGLRRRAAKIGDDYYDWVDMSLNMDDYREKKNNSLPR